MDALDENHGTCGEQEEHLSQFHIRLREHGMVEKEVKGDGNCQFRALADQLFNDQDRYAKLRTAAVDQLRSDPEHYVEFLPDEDWDSYVRRMEQDGTWGDHVTLQAVADAYKVTVHLYSAHPEHVGEPLNPETDRERHFPIPMPHRYVAEGINQVFRIVRLSHHPEVHYNSVHRRSEALQQQERQQRA